MSFTSQTVGSTSAAQAITLANQGTAALSLTNISASGDFAETNTCGASLAAGRSCTISVTFTPTESGDLSGSVRLTDNASGSPHTISLRGTGTMTQTLSCTGSQQTGNRAFPGCFTLTSPTSTPASSSPPAPLQASAVRARRVSQKGAGSPDSFQSSYAEQAAQIAALLNGTDPNPGDTIGRLGMSAFYSLLVQPTSDFCFNPIIYFANHPEASPGFLPAEGQLHDAGIWAPTDRDGQVCSAAVLNWQMSGNANSTQMALAIAAVMNNMAMKGNVLPQKAGDPDADLTSQLNSGLQNSASHAASPFQSVISATIHYDGTNYVYTVTFTASDFQQSYLGTIHLTQRPTADPNVYSGLLYFGLDNITGDPNNPPHLTAGTVRYQRNSQTSLDLSARVSYYATGSHPDTDPGALDANGELEPTYTGWYYFFERFGASFDPTSQWLTGNYLFGSQYNGWNNYGPANSVDPEIVFQAVMAGDGTGSAYYGFGKGIADSAAGDIDHFDCLRNGGTVHHLNAQFQPFQFDSTSGLYVPSTTVAAAIRYAPTSTCSFTVNQWDSGVNTGFWYDRAMQYSSLDPPLLQDQAILALLPATIDENVVADPDSADYPLSLFGNGTDPVQPQIAAASGYVPPSLF